LQLIGGGSVCIRVNSGKQRALPTWVRRTLTASTGALLTAACLLAAPGAASAAHRQVTLFADAGRLLSDPADSLLQFRALGATTVRVVLQWQQVAPDPTATTIPSGYNGSDPDDYPAAGWAPFDTIVQDAQRDGMGVDFTLSGGAPRWAQGAHIPPQGIADLSFAWKPNARLYGAFVHAVGVRYDGRFVPAGASAPLPAVRFWDLWNEPNFGQDLGPQAIDGSTVSVAPMMYRALVDAGWSALHQTGHGSDTIVIGGFAAEGHDFRVTAKYPQGLPGNYSQTPPLEFVRTLYCLNGAYKPLRGSAARARSCPVNAAGSRNFRAQNPGLFSASGVADHPYSGDHSPVNASGLATTFATFPQLGNLELALDRSQRAYGSTKRYAIYNDEYGYITNPPHGAGYASPATAAEYLNWAEYLSWNSPRLASYAQYLLQDPPPSASVGFASGLEFISGKPKATYFAFRLPLYMPRTTVSAGSSAEVWGNARPASFMNLDTGQAQTVAIQLQAGGHGPFQTVRTVRLSGSATYFDVHVAFPSGGNVRLAYTYPASDPFLPTGVAGTTITSRLVKLSV
jgi:hypothetical protein